MIKNREFQAKQPEEETIDLESFTNLDVKKDISLLQSKRKKMSNKLNEARRYIKSVDWNGILDNASHVKNNCNKATNHFHLFIAGAESKSTNNIKEVFNRAASDYKHTIKTKSRKEHEKFTSDCTLKTIKIHHGLLSEIKADFERQLKENRELFIVQLERDRHRHLTEVQNLQCQYLQSIQNNQQHSKPQQIPSSIPSSTSRNIHHTTNTNNATINTFGPSPNAQQPT